MQSELKPWDADLVMPAPAELAIPDVELLHGEGLRFAEVPVAPELIGQTLLESLVVRRSVHTRNNIGWVSVRAWRHAAKKTDIGMFKRAKLDLDRSVLRTAAGDISDMVGLMFGPLAGWTISTTAVGHSRRPDSFAVRLARSVARRRQRPFAKIFDDRFVTGVSHPKEFRDLPPLRLRWRKKSPILLIDDVATSGWHLEEALTLLRARGIQAFGVVWISGTVK